MQGARSTAAAARQHRQPGRGASDAQQQLIHISQATSTVSAASYQFDEATRKTRPLAKEATVSLGDNTANIHHWRADSSSRQQQQTAAADSTPAAASSHKRDQRENECELGPSDQDR